MATTDFSRSGTSVQVTQGATVVGTYDKEGSSYSFIATNLLQVLVVEAGLTRSFKVSLSDLRVSGAGSAPVSDAAALTALALVWGDGLPLEYVALLSQSGTSAPISMFIFMGTLVNPNGQAWAYVNVGKYSLQTLAARCYLPTTPVTLVPIYDATGTIIGFYSLYRNAADGSILMLETYDTGGNLANDILPANTLIQAKGL